MKLPVSNSLFAAYHGNAYGTDVHAPTQHRTTLTTDIHSLRNKETMKRRRKHAAIIKLLTVHAAPKHEAFPRMHCDVTIGSKVHGCKGFPGTLDKVDANILCLSETSIFRVGNWLF